MCSARQFQSDELESEDTKWKGRCCSWSLFCDPTSKFRSNRAVTQVSVFLVFHLLEEVKDMFALITRHRH